MKNHWLISAITTPAEADALLPLLDGIFGPRENTRAGLHRWVDSAEFGVWAARQGPKVAGAMVAHREERTGNFQLLAIAPEYRRQGLGRALAQTALDWMRSQGCRRALAMAWTHGSADTSEHLLRAAGFRDRGPLPDFYLAESLRAGHRCPICAGPCRCSARLFELTW